MLPVLTSEQRINRARDIALVGWGVCAFVLLSGFLLATTDIKGGLKVTGSYPAGDSVAQFGSTLPVFLRSNWPGIGFNNYFTGSTDTTGTTGFTGDIYVDQNSGPMVFRTSSGSHTGGTNPGLGAILALGTNNGGVQFQSGSFIKAMGGGTCVLGGAPNSTCTLTVPNNSICITSDTTAEITGVSVSGTTATAQGVNNFVASIICVQL